MVLVSTESPSAESTGKVTLHNIKHNFLASTHFNSEFLNIISPGVESTSSLHVDRSLNKVSHNFITETLHLINEVLLVVFIVLDILLGHADCLFLLSLTRL